MTDIKKIRDRLTDEQKEIIQKASVPKSTILFNIKGMIQILHEGEPFEFIEMGYEDVEALKKEKLLSSIRTMRQSHVLQGEEYELSPLGRAIAESLA